MKQLVDALLKDVEEWPKEYEDKDFFSSDEKNDLERGQEFVAYLREEDGTAIFSNVLDILDDASLKKLGVELSGIREEHDKSDENDEDE